MNCNIVNPEKIFHTNFIGSSSIVSKVLYCDELLNRLNFSSQLQFDVGFCQDIRQNLKILELLRARD